MFALFEQGYTPAEIARECKDGTASVAPFEIPRRTVQEIVKGMERERGGRIPSNLDQAADPELVAAFPKRILRILNRQLDRLDAKTRKGTDLTTDDLDRVKKINSICQELERKARAYDRRVMGPAAKRSIEMTLEDLARAIDSPPKANGAGGDSPPSNLPELGEVSIDPPVFRDPVIATIEAAAKHDVKALELIVSTERANANRPDVVKPAERALAALLARSLTPT